MPKTETEQLLDQLPEETLFALLKVVTQHSRKEALRVAHTGDADTALKALRELQAALASIHTARIIKMVES